MKRLPLIYNALLLAFTLSSCNTEQKSQSSNFPKQITSNTLNDQRSFDYQPQKPQNGIKYAAIEIGSLGLNYFLVEIDDQKRWRLIDSQYGRSNVIYGVENTDPIIDDIKVFKKELVDKGIDESKIYAVASSSVVKSNYLESLKKEIRDLGIKLTTVDANMEAQYALLATIPREFAEESFVADIGSGNTKLSWYDGVDTLTVETLGSKYFLNNVHDTAAFRQVRDALLQIPRKNRNLCFVLGGIVYDFISTHTKDSMDSRYVVLKTPGSYFAENEKQRAGKVIYSGLFSEPTYSYIFDKHSNFSIGYLLSK